MNRHYWIRTMATGFCLAGLNASKPVAAHPGMVHSDHPLEQTMERMHRTMAETPVSGDPDRDFAALMMPHHEGAIDMARLQLLHGKDPVLRRLAQEIIIEQQAEIELMRQWLAKPER
ncbi:MAG: DUF305 domain-containing protein [Anaerolineae bacterium]|nr:DUF305 domain-containing protein [Gloeobacterales cyanobacterium ES-bin-313]